MMISKVVLLFKMDEFRDAGEYKEAKILEDIFRDCIELDRKNHVYSKEIEIKEEQMLEIEKIFNK